MVAVAVALPLAASGCRGLADVAGGLGSGSIALPVVLLIVVRTALALIAAG